MGIVIYDAHKRGDSHALIGVLSITLFALEISGTCSMPLEVAIIASILLITSMQYKISNIMIKEFVGSVDKYSFCIYMTQAIPLQQICDYYYWNHGERLNKWIVFVIVLGGTALCSLAFYFLVDRNTKKAMDRILDRISNKREMKKNNRD